MRRARRADVPSQTSILRGSVVALTRPDRTHPGGHDRAALLSHVASLARLKGYEDAGVYDPATPYPGPLYFVPSETLTLQQANALGIRGADDLFGGVVPHAFVATKAISHPLVAPSAVRPPGWVDSFSARIADALLAGHTVFNLDDARTAGQALLRRGALRLKPVRATGGRGQSVAADAAAFESLLAKLDTGELQAHGLVLEENLDEVQTFSVGRLQVDSMICSYVGTQALTRSNTGAEVYGGSELAVARGDFDALLALAPPPHLRQAIELARRFDEAVHACFPGFVASRRNYDVALGVNAQGQTRCGVLEQSWRVGGATGAELAAMETFREQPGRSWVRARTVEVFGESPAPPAGAIVQFRGVDPKVGALTKYTLVSPDDGHAK
jgi:hypothetical protein